MLEKSDIFDMLKTTLEDVFEIPSEKITSTANIYEDLDIDSIDAIDLIDHIRRETGYKLQAEDFKNLRTIEDVVNVVYNKQKDVMPDA